MNWQSDHVPVSRRCPPLAAKVGFRICQSMPGSAVVTKVLLRLLTALDDDGSLVVARMIGVGGDDEDDLLGCWEASLDRPDDVRCSSTWWWPSTTTMSTSTGRVPDGSR